MSCRSVPLCLRPRLLYYCWYRASNRANRYSRVPVPIGTAAISTHKSNCPRQSGRAHGRWHRGIPQNSPDCAQSAPASPPYGHQHKVLRAPRSRGLRPGCFRPPARSAVATSRACPPRYHPSESCPRTKHLIQACSKAGPPSRCLPDLNPGRGRQAGCLPHVGERYRQCESAARARGPQNRQCRSGRDGE